MYYHVWYVAHTQCLPVSEFTLRQSHYTFHFPAVCFYALSALNDLIEFADWDKEAESQGGIHQFDGFSGQFCQ